MDYSCFNRPIAHSLSSRLTDARFSDFTIKCGTDEYKVHKLIITALSDYFARAIDFGKVSSVDV